jgi:hypothetical protein
MAISKINEIQKIKRTIKLKRQGRDLISDEIIDLQIRMALVVHKERLEAQIGAGFDPVVSKKIDAVIFLLENYSEKTPDNERRN